MQQQALQSVDRISAQPSPALSDVLFGPRSFDMLAALPSNISAIESALLFSVGLQAKVSIVGPSGWGKSELLKAAANRIRIDFGNTGCALLSAAEYASNSSRWDPQAPLLLDNVQDVLEKPKLRQQLRLIIERRVKTGRQTLISFTGTKLTRQMRYLLPNHHEWVNSTISQPDPQERQAVIRHMANRQNMVLSEDLIRLMGTRIRGNGSTLSGALHRLRLHGRAWIGHRSTLQACGIINPCLADNSSWDLQEAVREAALLVAGPSRFRDIAIYLLACEAMIPEADVSRYFNVEPAQVYAIGHSVKSGTDASSETLLMLDSVIEKVVERLLCE